MLRHPCPAQPPSTQTQCFSRLHDSACEEAAPQLCPQEPRRRGTLLLAHRSLVMQGGLRCPGVGAAGKVPMQDDGCSEHLVGFRQHLPTARQSWPATPARESSCWEQSWDRAQGRGQGQSCRECGANAGRTARGDGGKGEREGCHCPGAISSLQAGVTPGRAAHCPSPQTCSSRNTPTPLWLCQVRKTLRTVQRGGSGA